MKSLTRTTVVTLALLFTASLALAQAQPPGGNGPGNPQGGPGNPIMRCLQIVDLSDDQKAQIKGVLESFGPALKALNETLTTDRQALRAAIEAVPQDACAIGNALVKVQADEKAIREELGKVRSAIEATLTPEQKAKLAGCLEAPKDGPGPGH